MIKGKTGLCVDSRAEWRNWLNENHEVFQEIWLVYYKKHTGKPSLNKAEANQEALCFGSIDSIVQTIDDQRYMQKFTPRLPGSKWSELNKRRVAELEREGLMTRAGKKLIDIAKASGEWDLNRENPKYVEMPGVLKKALESDQDARRVWDKLSPSHRAQYCLWVSEAKRESTKERRAQKTIKMVTSGQSLSML